MVNLHQTIIWENMFVSLFFQASWHMRVSLVSKHHGICVFHFFPSIMAYACFTFFQASWHMRVSLFSKHHGICVFHFFSKHHGRQNELGMD